jgi:hypothetical protein
MAKRHCIIYSVRGQQFVIANFELVQNDPSLKVKGYDGGLCTDRFDISARHAGPLLEARRPKAEGRAYIWLQLVR